MRGDHLAAYQHEAVAAVYDHLRRRITTRAWSSRRPGQDAGHGHDLPRCGGAVGRRVLILAHVKELLEQAVDKLMRWRRTYG